ncbi:hypothetical protein BDL97_13G110900 [Sphagnum fallax]|nr:hypothetical protein BDL97_13G110900 [Sphagnum fallax]
MARNRRKRDRGTEVAAVAAPIPDSLYTRKSGNHLLADDDHGIGDRMAFDKHKRTHASAAAAAAAEATPSTGRTMPAVNSNWIQLQATLDKSQGAPFKKKAKPNSAASVHTGKVDATEKGVVVSLLLPLSDDCSVTRELALDCEMVGVGYEGKKDALARVSLVNKWGNVVYDKHVRPQEFVKDFRTAVSGVRPRDLRKGEKLWTVQKEVAELIKGHILVGHALRNDLKVLMLSHPKKHMRDTHSYKPLCNQVGRPRALRHLAALHLGCQIQEGEHNSVEDARAAMFLYQRFKEEWEQNLRHRVDPAYVNTLGTLRSQKAARVGLTGKSD